MRYELTQEFFFDAAHTLERAIEAEPSRRIHGHTYHAVVSIGGRPDPCLLYTSPSPRDKRQSRMPSSA